VGALALLLVERRVLEEVEAVGDDLVVLEHLLEVVEDELDDAGALLGVGLVDVRAEDVVEVDLARFDLGVDAAKLREVAEARLMAAMISWRPFSISFARKTSSSRVRRGTLPISIR
jgi:hypothetical protein